MPLSLDPDVMPFSEESLPTPNVPAATPLLDRDHSILAFNRRVLNWSERPEVPLLERLRHLDMWAQVQVQNDELVALQPLLVDSGARLLFDHCGRPNPAAGLGQPGFQALLGLAETGRAVVKISSLVKTSVQPFPHPDAWPFVQALVDAYTPQSLVWASDWPFLRATQRIDVGTLLRQLGRSLPDAADRHRLWWRTPARWLGFSA